MELSDALPAFIPDPPDLNRVHTEHRLALPFNAGIFRVNPFVRALATYASDSAYAGGDFQGSENRSGVGAGATISTTFARSFNAESKLLDLNRLRHIVIPYAGIETLSVSGADSADFLQLDAVDAIDSGTTFRAGLRQRLQTKRLYQDRWRSVNWAELDVAYVNRSSDSVMTSLDEDYIQADFELLLTDHISLHSQDNRLGLDDQPDVYNVGLAVNYLPDWRVGLDYDRITDINSTLTLDLTYKLSDRYKLLLYEQYELDSRGAQDKTNLETVFVIRRLLHEWVLDLGIHIEESNDETAFVFGFGPAGWGAFTDLRRAGRR